MRIIFAALILSLCGCRHHLSNEAIIQETKKCQDAGLEAEYGRNLNNEIIDVQCGPAAERQAKGEQR